MLTVDEQLTEAQACYRGGQLKRAEQLCREALAADELRCDAHALLGTLCRAQGKPSEAIAAFGRAAHLNPRDALSRHQLGICCGEQGQLEAAVFWLRDALRLQPDSPEIAQHLQITLAVESFRQGLTLASQGRLDEAAACCRRAVELKPDYADAQDGLADILATLGQFDEAVVHYQRAVALRPDAASIHVNLSSVLIHLDRLDEAANCCHRALALVPKCAEAANNLAAVLSRRGKLAEAVACYRNAIEWKPEYAEACYNLGNLLLGLGQLDEAAACFQRTLELKSDCAEAQQGLGVVLLKQGKPQEAMAAAERALAIRPDFVDALVLVGTVAARQCNTEQAENSFRRAIALQPKSAEAHYNLAVLLWEQDRLDEALRSCTRALEIEPNYAEAHYTLGTVSMRQRKLASAAASFRRAMELKPDYADAHFAQSLLWLSEGRFAEGWPEYEWYWRREGKAEAPFSTPPWSGAPLDGQTILLHSDHGLGDTLQFVRYARNVKERGGRVIVRCPQSLTRLLASCPGVDLAIDEREPLPKFDAHARLLSLPAIFGTSLDTIPAEVPYLFPAAELVEAWRCELDDEGRLKIGIAWQGSAANPADRLRSIPLATFAGIAALGGVQLYSLQFGAGREQLDAFKGARPILDLGDRLGDFQNTAAIVRNLDLVITCDSAPAHLAGALGAAVWVALPFAADWRWLLDRSDSPWYPTMRLFRQQRAGDWAGVFQEMERALREWIAP